MSSLNYWEIIADKIHAGGRQRCYCSAITRDGWRRIVGAYREGHRYIVHSGKLLSAFLEDLECAGTRSTLVKRAGRNQQRGRLREVLHSVA